MLDIITARGLQRIRAWFPVVIWMILIFVGSTDLLSSRQTSRFIGPFLRFFIPDMTDSSIGKVQAVARKSAHFLEYLILAMLVTRAMRASVITGELTNRQYVHAWGIAAMYACSDEFHQSLVATRQGSILDVMIDASGALLGVYLAKSRFSRSLDRRGD